jgi:hypothetical protein
MAVSTPNAGSPRRRLSRAINKHRIGVVRHSLLADVFGLASIQSDRRSKPVSFEAVAVLAGRSFVRRLDTGLSSYLTARNQPKLH